jgi:hypothetical protein
MSAPRISAEEFRNRYLASLRTQIAVDAKNLQANQLFKQTAQPSQIEDNRSITEKSADIARLSQLLIKELSKITDMGSANDIVNSMSDDDKRFLLEQFGAISSEAERRFKFGFTKDIFSPFFKKFRESYLATGGFSATPAEIAGEVVKEEKSARQKPIGSITGIATASGEVDSNLEPVDINDPQLSSGAWKATRPKIIAEIKRQLRELSLKPDQVERRKSFLTWFDSITPKTKAQYQIAFGDNEPRYNDMNDFLGGTTGRGIKGRGLKKSKSSPTLTEGIPQAERFAKFGRYMIDKQKLKDGQCVIRFTSGACIHKIPARRIGKEVQNVLSKIAGGALPTYDDINSLNQDDRRYLFNIQKSAKMDAQIPSPDKDAETKEMEDFEKMRGQILAGNDNRDLLKKFKLTLLKFGKDGRIPRREVNEVLLEMASMGM